MIPRPRLMALDLLEFDGASERPEDLPDDLAYRVAVDDLVVRTIDWRGQTALEYEIELTFSLTEAEGEGEGGASYDEDDDHDQPDHDDEDDDAASTEAEEVWVTARFRLVYTHAPEGRAGTEALVPRVVAEAWPVFIGWLHGQLAAMRLPTTDLPPAPPRHLVREALAELSDE